MKNCFRSLLGILSVLFFLSLPVVSFAQRPPRAARPPVASKAGSHRTARQPRSYEEAVDQADAFVRSGKYIEALASAQQGIRMNPTDHRAYYYASYSLYKRELYDEAQPLAEKALELSSADNKDKIDRLIEAISKGRTGTEQIRIAERNGIDGKPEEAAVAYAKAYELMPYREDIAIKAANLYSTQLNNPAESVRLLKLVVLRAQTPDAIKTASEMLSKAEVGAKAAAERKAEEDRRAGEDRRVEGERRRLEDERRAEQERNRAESIQRNTQIATLQAKKSELESQRYSLQQDYDSKIEEAQSSDESAARFEADAERYGRDPSGGFASAYAQHAADKRRRDAQNSRGQAQRIQRQINEIERQVNSINQDLDRLH